MPNYQSAEAPPPTKSIDHVDNSVTNLADIVNRAEALADRLAGTEGQDAAASSKLSSVPSSTAARLRDHGERIQSACSRIEHALNRIDNAI